MSASTTMRALARPSITPRALSTAGISSQRTLRTQTIAPAAATPTPSSNASETVAANLRMRRIETMPFQTYQFALDYIKKDREVKESLIKESQKKIENIEKKQAQTGANQSRRLSSLRRHLEYLKIQADINNPRVKYSFDQGIVSMDKPVYRFLMDRKWREMKRPVLMQRLTQMHVVPDILPKIDPVVHVPVRFGGRDIAPGSFVKATDSERPPTLKIIPFTPEPMLCTIAVVDPDVPDLERDSFNYRLHWLVSNVPISPTETQAIGTGAKPSDTIVSWLPPHACKGEPYHRLSLFVFKQSGKIDPATLKDTKREGFNTRSFVDKNKVETIGAFMWRAEWDESTKAVMQKHNLPGWDTMYIRRRA